MTAGSSLTLGLAATSRLAALGIADLTHSSVRLVDARGTGAWQSTARLTPALAYGAHAATLTVPAGTPAGRYGLIVAVADAGDRSVAVLTSVVDVVVAAPAVPAATTAAHRGLRSDTGWDEHADATAPAGSSPLVPVGAGMVLVAAAAAGTVVVRSRRRPTSSE